MRNINFSYSIASGIFLIIFLIMFFANEFIFSEVSVRLRHYSILTLYAPLIFSIIFGIIGRFFEKRNRTLSAISITLGVILIILVSIEYWALSGMIWD